MNSTLPKKAKKVKSACTYNPSPGAESTRLVGAAVTAHGNVFRPLAGASSLASAIDPHFLQNLLAAQGARQRQIILESFTLWEKKIMSSTFIFLLIYYSSFERLVQNLLFFLSPKTVKYIHSIISLLF